MGLSSRALVAGLPSRTCRRGPAGAGLPSRTCRRDRGALIARSDGVSRTPAAPRSPRAAPAGAPRAANSTSGLSISLPLPHTATHPRKPTVLVRDLSTREVAVKWIAHFRYSAIPQLFERAGRDQRCKSQATLGVRPSQPTSPAVEEQVYGPVS